MSEKKENESGYEYSEEGKSDAVNVTITATDEAEGEDDAEEYEGDELTEGEEEEGEEAGSKTSTPTPESITPTAPPSAAAAKAPRKRRVPRRKKGEVVNLENVRIGFLGTGKIAESIVKGFLNITKIDPKRIFMSSKTKKNYEHFKSMGVNVSKRNYDIFGRYDCDVIFLAFHGYVIRQLYKHGGTRPLALTTNFIPNQRHPFYVLSLVGGVTLEQIKATLLNPDNPKRYLLEMHRIVLNHSCSIGLGIGAIDVEPDSKKCAPLIRDLLTSICKLEFVSEKHMDVICAVGGNGQAFYYYFCQALIDGGFKLGLPKQYIAPIVARTLYAAAQCLIESGKTPTELRNESTAPSSGAIYGINILDKSNCMGGVASAVESAYKRIKQLAEEHPSG